MSVDCLLDTNSIVKRYHTELGTEVIDYLFNKSPTVLINFLNLQVVEVIRTLHHLRAKNEIKTDEILKTLVDTFLKEIDDGRNSGKIKLYEFASEHLKDLGVYEPIFAVPRPIYFQRLNSGKVIKKKKERADTIDALMLLIMREVHFHTEESYLITSDEHVLDVAKYLKIKTINPEIVKINELPRSLDVRREARDDKHLKVICYDAETKQPLGSTATVDICKGGICVKEIPHLTQGRNIIFKISPFNKEDIFAEVDGQILWNRDKETGIRFRTPVPEELYVAIVSN